MVYLPLILRHFVGCDHGILIAISSSVSWDRAPYSLTYIPVAEFKSACIGKESLILIVKTHLFNVTV